MQLETFFKAILPFMGGLLVGLFTFRATKVGAFVLIVALGTLALTGALMPVKEAVAEHTRSAVPAITTFFKSVPAGAIVGVLLGIAITHLRRRKGA